MAEQPTKAVQDYLKATAQSRRRRASSFRRWSSAALLEVRAPSVTGMLKRLAEGGWVGYEPGRGARLTPLGRTEARRVIRRHRLMELFLTRVLGLDWSEVDAEAETLEHAISPRLEQAIAEHLGEPLEDPHGHPIPTREGELARRNLRPLHTLEPGHPAVIREVQDDNPRVCGAGRTWACCLGLWLSSFVTTHWTAPSRCRLVSASSRSLPKGSPAFLPRRLLPALTLAKKQKSTSETDKDGIPW